MEVAFHGWTNGYNLHNAFRASTAKVYLQSITTGPNSDHRAGDVTNAVIQSNSINQTPGNSCPTPPSS